MIFGNTDVKEFFPSLRIIITEEEYPKLFYFLSTLKKISFDFFNCDFKNNICSRERLYGCCSTCLRDLGFYKYDSFLLIDPEVIMNLFSFDRYGKQFGFLLTEENIEGCCLPREYRSNPCNIHKCFKFEDKNQQKEVYKYDELISNINKYFMNPNNLDKCENEMLIDIIMQNKEDLELFNITLE